MTKSLRDLAWNVSEQEYREDPALSYSLLAKYEREGFCNISSLFEHEETQSLLFGSIVDTLITGTKEEFDSRFVVCDLPNISDNIKAILTELKDNIVNDNTKRFQEINDSDILIAANNLNYATNWKDATRINKIKEEGKQYYNALISAGDKRIVTIRDYEYAMNCKETLLTSDTTRYYFYQSPFDSDIERLYQLKFKLAPKRTDNSILDHDIEYRCMADLLVVDHKNKTIQPVDLKTSHSHEYLFPKSFLKWRYDIQARLYWRLIYLTCKQDDYFKDFTILPYKFIIINKESLTPLVWDFENTELMGSFVVTFHNGEKKIFRDPYTIGEELYHYLTTKSRLPIGITDGAGCSNKILKWLEECEH